MVILITNKKLLICVLLLVAFVLGVHAEIQCFQICSFKPEPGQQVLDSLRIFRRFSESFSILWKQPLHGQGDLYHDDVTLLPGNIHYRPNYMNIILFNC